jgi:DNA modification methylase
MTTKILDKFEANGIELRLADMRYGLSDLAPQVDVIITDPPYGKEYLWVYEELGLLAKNILKPEGMLAVMTGHLWMREYLEAISKYLPYRHMAAYLQPGASSIIWGMRLRISWKPILIFGSKSKFIKNDVFKSKKQTKKHHPWEQSVEGFEQIVYHLSRPGELVVDPFMGTGTTAIACLRLGRKFIGTEIDPETYQIAVDRLKKEVEN